MKRLFLLVGLCAFGTSAVAEIIFSQDFSSPASGPVSSYVSKPAEPGEWDEIRVASPVSASIVNGALEFTRSSSSGTGKGVFTRSTDLTPVPKAMIYRFDLQVSGITASSLSAATFQVGSGFHLNSDAAEPGVHSQVTLALQSSSGCFAFRDPSNPNINYYDGKRTITWVVNNSGAPFRYLAPDQTWQTVDNDKWDLWVDWVQPLDERPAIAGGASQPLTDLKFSYTAGAATIRLDNFRIENEIPIPVVPEPKWTAVAAAGLMAAAAMIAENRKKKNEEKLKC